MRTTPSGMILFCTALLLVNPRARGEDGLKLPSFNPFAKQQAKDNDPGTATDDDSRSGFRLPTLPAPAALPKPSMPSLPSFSLPKFELPKLGGPSTGSRQPSAWTRLSRETKALFAKTKSTLMPWTEESTPRRPPTGSNSRRVARRPSRPSLIPKIFASEPEEPRIGSVKDYLALPRPMP